MPSGVSRASLALVVLLLAVAATAACSGMLRRDYEYEEELYLGMDGAVTMNVNASIASLVALHGARLDIDPDARPDREAIRQLFSGPGAVVDTPTFFRRDGRRFVHISVRVPGLADLRRIRPFAWSAYRFDRTDDKLTFTQVVGRPSGRLKDPAWTGREVVAFRMHVPSKVLFENATSEVQRGNILAWEQPLADRLAGAPLDLRVDMEPSSILRSTLLLFGSTVVAALAVMALVIWWVVRRGRAQLASSSSP